MTIVPVEVFSLAVVSPSVRNLLLSVVVVSLCSGLRELKADEKASNQGLVVALQEATSASTKASSTASVTARSPEDFLGRSVGTDFELADWTQVSDYYHELAKTSPRVKLEKVGKTSEGRDFLIAIISDQENLAQLNAIKRYSKTIADPRGATEAEKEEAIRNGKVIVFVTPTMHATEVAATEMAMHYAWMLATSDEEPWRSARKDAVVVITPSLNPDGVDHVVHWYRDHVGTPLEASSLNRLYQLYTGHDNNRDWFMLTQAETRLLTRLLYHEWLPQFLWDVHQQGNTTERFFVPPYRDPLNPNFDGGIVAGINLIGARAVMDMNRDGLTGIATGVSYDNWWNGGNRSVPGRHHIIGILTEAASVKIASPIFQAVSTLNDPLGAGQYQPSNQFIKPWPGGWWRLSNIIEYELAFGRSLLGSVVREPQFWLRNKMEAAQRTIDAGVDSSPTAWLVTVDNRDLGAVRRLIDVLLATGVDVHRSEEAFEADGRQYPKGTIVIRRDQPYGNYVKDLFELQAFPPGTKPYDVTGWTLPLLLGVRRVEVRNQMTAPLAIVNDASEAIASFSGDERLANVNTELGDWTSSADSDAWRSFAKQLSEGHSIRMLVDADQGGLLVSNVGGADSEHEEKPADGITVTSLPRIGVFSPWTASMDEGWLRWVLDDFEIPFTTVRNEQIRAGDLTSILDVLVIPSITSGTINRGVKPGAIPDPMTGGLDPEGALASEEFVRRGGTLITMDSSSAWAIDLLRLPVVDVTAKAKGFSCPGSVLRGVVQPHLLTAGLPHDIALFFSGSSGWRVMTKAEREAAGVDEREMTMLVKYAPNRLLMSGFLEGEQTLEGHGAWVSLKHGEGNVHLFGFRPHYRAWTQATFHLLFRTMLLSPSLPTTAATVK